MKERKYKEDYDFEYAIDDRGRETRSAVYRGKWYSYDGGTQAGRRALLFALSCLVVFVVLYIGYLELNAPSSRCMYVLPVASCALVVMAYWIMGLYAMWRAPERMTRLQRENGIGRVLRSCAGCAVLLLMACAGDLCFMLFSLKERAPEEFLGFALLLCAAGAAMGCCLRIKETYRMMHVFSEKTGGNKA